MARQDKNTLFRREALERLNDIDELDRLVTVTHPRAWLTLGAVAALIITAVVWASVGRLATTVGGDGILLAGGHTLRVSALSEGQLTDLSVDIGDTVHEGQPIAVVLSAADQAKVQDAALRVAGLKKDYVALASAADPDAVAIAAAKAELDQARRESERIRATVDKTGVVISPYTGTVGSLQAYPGQYLSPGAPIATIEPTDVPLVATLYLPIDDGKKVRKGQEVQVVPATVSVDQYGYLRARVTFVADLASSPESMDAVLQNAFLVQDFAASGPVLRVEATLVPAPDNPSGYAWSSSQGPDTRISTGTTCTARIVLETAPPITYAFPALKRILGGGG